MRRGREAAALMLRMVGIGGDGLEALEPALMFGTAVSTVPTATPLSAGLSVLLCTCLSVLLSTGLLSVLSTVLSVLLSTVRSTTAAGTGDVSSLLEDAGTGPGSVGSATDVIKLEP